MAKLIYLIKKARLSGYSLGLPIAPLAIPPVGWSYAALSSGQSGGVGTPTASHGVGARIEGPLAI